MKHLHMATICMSAALIALAGCTGASHTNGTPSSAASSAATSSRHTSSAAAAHKSISIQNFQFSVSALTVKKGTTVTWTNNDGMGHTITGDAGGPQSGTLTPGQSYSFTFTVAGTFAYHCAIHPSMVGTVIVTP